MKNFIIITTLLSFVLYGSAQSVNFNQIKLSSKTAVFNVKTYGAVGDSIAMDTKAIQLAIDACNKAGGGKVWVPAGEYIIGTIKLKSNVTLSLDYGAYLLGSENIADYDTDLIEAREGNVHCLIYAENAQNVRIEGLGVIDGRGTPQSFPRERGRPRPRLIRMVNIDKLTFSGVTYKRPAFWGIHIIDSKNVHFNGVTVRFRNNGYNNDGLDIDGCENVLIENCDIEAGDDAICLKSSLHPCRNFVVKNCKVASGTAALKFGTSSYGGFLDVKVTDCYFYDSPMGAIKLQLVDGGKLENVDISRITMKNVGNPIFIRLGNRGRTYEKTIVQKFKADVQPEGRPVGTLKNIRISDVVAEVTFEDREQAAMAAYKASDKKDILELSGEITDMEKSKAGPIMIAGIPGHYVENVVLENISISYPGGGTENDSKNYVPEDIARYPEQFFFGVLPAWGAYIRHAKNVQFTNVKMEARSEDKREMIVLDDVEGFINK
ncbi:glycoside hydrolase family 28 protein [Neotamlana sedimentorum]|uniref:glycoside hydrolase family 28 protein n=1 Tax=Neotamlana sedimentorum TaxID=1435349 RepID=UPI0009E2FEC2|nr:glycosyl hydrolase family 28 protein [Tamlana sedimentorum]